MALPELLANSPVPGSRTPLAVLSDDIDNTVGVIGVTAPAPAALQAPGQFRILIDSELMLVTAGADTTTWTVQRGVEGTSQVPHGAGAPAFHVPTAGGLDARYVSDGRGVAQGDVLVFSGTTWAVLSKGSTGQQMMVRSDGTIGYVDPPAVSAAAWGMLPGNTATQNQTALQAALDAAVGAQEVFIPAGSYSCLEVTPPYATNGLRIRGAGAGLSGAAKTTINYTGSGTFVTLGGGTAGNFTRYQSIEDMEIVGTASAVNAVRFFSTRWCSLKRLYIRNFNGAGVAAVVLDASATAQYPNYYNRLEHCFFDTCTWGVYLRGEGTAGTGANSNVLEQCAFNNCTTNGVMIDGGDTNTLRKCEFGTGTGIGVRIGANSASIYNAVDDCQFDGCAGGVQLDANAQQTTLDKNHGGSYTVTNNGTGTRRRDSTTWLPIVTPTYSASITPDSSAGPWQKITVTNATAFTINAPTNAPGASSTAELTIEIVNSSGGAIGAATWNPAFVFAGLVWTNPASAKRRYARFEWNGSAWICTAVATADY